MDLVHPSIKRARENRQVGFSRAGAVTTGVAVTGGLGSLIVAAALAVSHQAGASTPAATGAANPGPVAGGYVSGSPGGSEDSGAGAVPAQPQNQQPQNQQPQNQQPFGGVAAGGGNAQAQSSGS